MKSVLLLGQIMFYSKNFTSQAQLGTKDIQKLDFEKVVFTSKKPKFMIFYMLPERPIILYCVSVTWDLLTFTMTKSEILMHTQTKPLTKIFLKNEELTSF